MSLIEIKNVNKSFGSLEVLKNISFNIEKNTIVGILGPNGSGKSTLMRIISGLIKTWKGDICFYGDSIRLNNYYLHSTGFLIEDPAFYEHLTAIENLNLLARLSKTPAWRVNQALKRVDLDKSLNKKVSQFSYGMKQRLGIAQAILNDADILFLDEPNNGLDPNGMIQMNKTITDLNKLGKTICISTHILEDVKELCSHIIILKYGELILDNSIENLLMNTKKYVIKSKNSKNVESTLSKIKNLKIIEKTDKKIVINSSLKIQEIIQLIPHDVDIFSINKEPDIENLFL